MRFEFLQAVTDEHFAQAARMSALLQEGFRLESERDERRQEREKEARADGQDAMTVMVMGTLDEVEAAEMQARIELHDRAVIEALMENEERLVAANQRVEELLEQAHVLEDGRRVFKTEDGRFVFDEHGNEVAASEVDPRDIEDFRPSWETFDVDKGERDGLLEERRELLEYQEKLDQAQTRMANGQMTRDDFDQLDRLMADDVPLAVRRHLPPDDPAALQRDQAGSFADRRPEDAASLRNTDPGRSATLTYGLN